MRRRRQPWIRKRTIRSADHSRNRATSLRTSSLRGRDDSSIDLRTARDRRIALIALAALVAMPCARSAVAADPTSFDSDSTANKPVQWRFGTPESDGRPGIYYFYRGVEAIDRKQYAFARDMYETSASWGYKPAQYNLAIMYAKGEGFAIDKPRAMAWAALAAERGDKDYVDAREVIYATLSKDEFAQANVLWRDLKQTYGDEHALRRAKARWAEVKASMTGSPTGFPGNLRVGGHDHMGTEFSSANGFILNAGSIDGAIAYRQFRESTDPYDPRFVPDVKGTATVEPIVPVAEPAK
jgi:hypothetical protein